jgi:hypothetical protein
VSDYHLLIFQTHGLQDVADFEAMRDVIHARYPEIRTFIYSISLKEEDLYQVENNPDGVIPVSIAIDEDSPVWRQVAAKPTLMFSPVPLELRSNLRGYRMFAQHLSKLDEMRVLGSMGFPVPRTIELTRGTVLDEREWGPLVVVKPISGRGGDSVRLLKTEDVSRQIRTGSVLSESGSPLLVQQWINTGPCISGYRAMTVLDKVVYIVNTTVLEASDFSPAVIGGAGLNVAYVRRPRQKQLVKEWDVHQLAARICRNLDFTTTFGLDILREAGTDQLYVIEMNSGFPTWQLSSRYIKWLDSQVGSLKRADRYAQFNAIEEIGHSLAHAVFRLAR